MIIKINMLAGLLACVVGVVLVTWLHDYTALPIMLLALLVGMGGSGLNRSAKIRPGIEWSATTLLRCAVALLGLQISFSQVISLGWQAIFLMLSVIFSSILLGCLLAKKIGLPLRMGLLTGGAVGICGASAAIAIACILPEHKNKERETLLAILGVTSLSTIAMVAYPYLVPLFNFNPREAGLFLGGTIHDVAQVVGAGYSVSEQTGALSVLAKLIRVAMLAPVILIIISLINRGWLTLGTDTVNCKPKFPLFVIVFMVLVIIRNVLPIPDDLLVMFGQLTQWALVTAIVAIGLKTKFKQLASLGVKPIILLLAETLWIAVWVIAIIVLIR